MERCPNCDSYQVVEESGELVELDGPLERTRTMNAGNADGSRSLR